MKNIHILPTDKPSRLAKSTKSGLNAAKKGEGLYESGKFGITNFNIYITNSEEIKEERCWVINTMNKIESVPHSKWGKLIILTTDQDLIKDGVQAIDDEFLEWFVKNPSCEEVEVEESNLLNTSRTYLGVDKYKIIISKEEPKQESFVERMKPLQEQWQQNMDKELSKQETLEEAIVNHSNDAIQQLSFLNGANWQQKNSNIDALEFEIKALKSLIQDMDATIKSKYSEEEVITFLLNCRSENPIDVDKWFEQFKKK